VSELRNLPKVDALAQCEELQQFTAKVRVQAAREAVDSERARIQAGKPAGEPIQALALRAAIQMTSPSLRPVINATGVILHTGAGRARLAGAAVAQVSAAAMNHSAVEIDLDSGKRGDRQAHVRQMLCGLTGAEDALVVNNCAAAVFLSLHALANRKEVILSRGQMVEIGGSFRMPDIVRQSGCKLVEVGTTNRTRLSDYEAAITPRTAAILRCHPSNFRVVGFTEEPPAADLARLAKTYGLMLIDDVGSGCLFDTAEFGLPHEATLSESVASGADVVMASGDKMLGGPQAGLILGTSEAVRKIAKHPLARALRIDKLCLAGLEATLRLYVTGQEEEIPTIRYLRRSLEEIRSYAERLQHAYQGRSIVAEGITEIGGGSLPDAGVKTFRVGLQGPGAERISAALRTSEPPILTRIEEGTVWLDPRTLDPDEIAHVEQVLRELAVP
jgi:L-seryl-tRNA(Ser) seleniumtransferase